jgi:hypothetical protein
MFRFLARLDPSYEVVRSQLLQPELPSLDNVMGRIEGEETRQLVMGSQPINDQEAKAFAAFRNHNPKSEMRGAQTAWCEHCKLKGHKKKMIVGSSTLTFDQRGPKSKKGIKGRGAISARREEIICRRKQKKGTDQ